MAAGMPIGYQYVLFIGFGSHTNDVRLKILKYAEKRKLTRSLHALHLQTNNTSCQLQKLEAVVIVERVRVPASSKSFSWKR